VTGGDGLRITIAEGSDRKMEATALDPLGKKKEDRRE